MRKNWKRMIAFILCTIMLVATNYTNVYATRWGADFVEKDSAEGIGYRDTSAGMGASSVKEIEPENGALKVNESTLTETTDAVGEQESTQIEVTDAAGEQENVPDEVTDTVGEQENISAEVANTADEQESVPIEVTDTTDGRAETEQAEPTEESTEPTSAENVDGPTEIESVESADESADNASTINTTKEASVITFFSDADKAALSEVEKAFADLAASKDLMALIYLTDACEVKVDPALKSAVTAILGSGHTVYVKDVRITEEGIRYYVSFWQNGTEQGGYVEEKYLAYADEDWASWRDTCLMPFLVELFERVMGEKGLDSDEGTGIADGMQSTVGGNDIAEEQSAVGENDIVEEPNTVSGNSIVEERDTVSGNSVVSEELDTVSGNAAGDSQSILGESLFGLFDTFTAGAGIAAYNAGVYEDVNAFPDAFKSKLQAIKDEHPNWIFVPVNTGLDFDTAVSAEMGDKSWIQGTDSNKKAGYTGDPTGQGSWTYATRKAVSYYLDTRNYLDDTHIFAFEQLTFNSSYHSEAAVQKFLDGTFMKGSLPDDQNTTYANAFYAIGKNRKLSPTHLASRVYQEQGKGTSPLISGTYQGYEGYYNYFNVGANGASSADVIKNGLEYAKKSGWNTAYKSLEGGAATIGNNYILKGQDTSYLQKFNVAPGAASATYTHQYMQNIQAPWSEASSTRKIYNGAGSLNSAFVFKIPIYSNMPDGEEPSEPELPEQPTEIVKCRVVFYDENGTNIIRTIDGITVGTALRANDFPSVSTVGTTIGRQFVGWYTETRGRGEKVATGTQVYAEEIRLYPYFAALTEGFFVVPVGSQFYTGSAVKPRVIVYDAEAYTDSASDRTPLVYGKDYTVTYKNNIKVNDGDSDGPVITVKGKGNYSGTQKIYFDILPVSLTRSDIRAENIVVKYTGKRIKASPVIMRGTKKLVKGTDYTVAYPDTSEDAYKAPGNYPVEVTGKGGYSGTITLYESITSLTVLAKKSIAKAKITGITNMVYTGDKEDMEQSFDVTLGGHELTESVDGVQGDFITVYKNINKVGTATIELHGIGNYTGKLQKTFKITKASLKTLVEQSDVSMDVQDSYPYVKGKVTPPVSLTLVSTGTDLVEGVDYTVSYKYNTRVTPDEMDEDRLPVIIIKGKGNFKGTIKSPFWITDGQFEDTSKVSVEAKDVVYKNRAGAYKTTVTITDENGKALKSGTDFSKAYEYYYAGTPNVTDAAGNPVSRSDGEAVDPSDRPGPGTTIRVRVTAKGAYRPDGGEAKRDAYYRIITADIGKASVKVRSKTYLSGRPVTLTEDDITVTLDGVKLVCGKDFIIDEATYRNNIGKGTASVVIRGMESAGENGTVMRYGGSKIVKFKIGSRLFFW